MQERKCVICGSMFVPKSYNQYVCMNKHIFNCPVCNKTYEANRNHIKIYLKEHRIQCCSKECSTLQMKQTKLERYGDTNYNNIQQMKQTKLERYGNENYNNIQQMKQTKLEKYGNEKYYNIDKSKKTKQERYGNENYNNRLKFKQTCIEKYGTDVPLKNKEILNKYLETTNKKYGGNSPMTNEQVKAKRQQNQINKYGVNNHMQKHYSVDTQKILFDREEFIRFCESISDKLTFKYASYILGIQDTTFRNYYLKYDCDKIYPIQEMYTKELEIKELLDKYNIQYIMHDKTILKPKELDYYIPEKKLAIEFNGTYWHSSIQKLDKNYHYDKSKECEEKGIRLIHIFEYEWNNERQRPILENIIKNALGINNNKIYARNCNIIIKTSKEMKEFLNKNNIQGFRGGKFAICLADKKTNEIYMAYMMGKAFFGRGKYEWEVIRGATKLGYTVVGGASKIFKYFIETYKPNSCVYYIDYNYFNGNSLKNLPQMQFIKTQPSYKNYYVKTNTVKSRDPVHHKDIVNGYANGTILQIYNAGTKVYVWKKAGN